jgi:NAD(P)-dependent dehydrogenase (short-subunit alcohol dehydrogenase family)
LLLERGDRVAATCRKIEALADLESRYGDRLWKAALDVTDTPQVKSVVGRAFAELGSIEVVVNNAGYVLLGAAEEVSDEQIVQQLATNLVGSIHVTRAVLPLCIPKTLSGFIEG